jgi:hypothetical protein
MPTSSLISPDRGNRAVRLSRVSIFLIHEPASRRTLALPQRSIQMLGCLPTVSWREGAPWQMANPERSLSFSDLENNKTVVAVCGACGKKFESSPQAGKLIDDQLLIVRAEFDEHDCTYDPRHPDTL